MVMSYPYMDMWASMKFLPTFPSECKYSCHYGNKERSSQQNKDHVTYWVYFSVFLPVTLDTSLIFDNWMKWYLEVSISDREDDFHSSS